MSATQMSNSHWWMGMTGIIDLLSCSTQTNRAMLRVPPHCSVYTLPGNQPTYVLLSVVSKRIKYLTQQCFKLSEVNCFSLTACWLLFQMASMFWCSGDWSSLAAAMGSDYGENLSLIQLRPKWPVLCWLSDLRERLWQQELVFLICTRFSTLNNSPLIVKNLCQQTNAQQQNT